MKNLIFKSSFHEKLKMLLIVIGLVVTSLTTQVWAGAGWWDNGGVVLKFDLNGSEVSRTLNKTSAGGATSLGTVTTSMKLKTFTANVWKDGSGNICSAGMYYQVKNSSGTVVLDKSGTITAATYKSASGSNQVWEKSSINVDLLNGGLAPGTYTFVCWFKATGSTTSSSACGTELWYSNNGNNYSYTFIVPSKNLTVAGAANGNTVSGSVTGITKGTAYDITATPTTGYTFGGWSATSGSSSISIGNTSSASTTVTFSNYSNDATVTASFTETMSSVSLVASPSGKGSFTIGGAAATSTTVGVTTTKSVTAVPTSGYHFVSWSVSGGATISGATDNPVTVTGTGTGTAATLTATFEADAVNSLTVSAGTHVTTVTGSTSPVTLGNKYAINATAFEAGYEFLNWTASPAANATFDDANSASTNVTVKNGSVVVTANAQEKMTTITINVNPSGAGTLTVGGSAFTPGNTTTAGVTTSREIEATASSGKVFLDWSVSGNATGSASTNTYTLKGNGSSGSGTLTANFGILSGWNMEGEDFGGWSRPSTYKFAYPYRGMSGVYYIPTTLNKDKWWKVNNGSTPFNATNASTTVSKGTIYNLVEEWSNSSKVSTTLSNVWVVINTNDTKKIWVQDSQTFYNVNVTNEGNGSKGTYKVTLNSTSAFTKGANVFETTQFANGEKFDITVTGVSGYIPTIRIGSTDYTFWKEADTYTATGTMGTADVAVTISYTASYAVTFAKTTGCATLTATGPSSTTITTGTKVKSGTSITFNQTATSGYEFSKWYSTNTGTGGTQWGTESSLTKSITSTTSVYPIYNALSYTVILDKQTSAPGYSAPGTIGDQTVTYNATLPSIEGTIPTAADGYAFMGFFTEPLGAGLKVINPDKSWETAVEDLISASKWIKKGGVTLYAYYKKAEITGFTFSTGSSVVAPSTNMTVTATLSPTPQPTTHIDWRILHSNDNPLDNQPSFGTGITTNTFASPTTSGMYKMEATLRTGNVANAGTVLSTYTASFQVAGDHTVTLQYKCGDETIKASTTMTGKPLVWTSVTAPEIFGYTFSKWIPGDGISIRKGSTEDTVGVATTATIQIKAIYDGKLTAIYTQNSYIYFKNTLGWNSVRVNFYNDNYWGYNSDANKGTGNNGITNRNLAMTLVEGTTDIYYYDYGTAGITPTRYVSFTQEDMNGYQYFYQASPNVAHVVYPSRYSDALTTDKATEGGFYAGTPMFVPLASQSGVAQNDNRAEYYNSGYWTKYTSGTGYHLEIYYSDGTTKIRDLDFTSSDELMPMTTTANLEAGQTYKFQVKRDGDVYYGNTGEMTYANHGQSTAWEMTNANFAMCRLTTNAAGDYTFKLSYSGNSSTPPQYRLRMAVDYPIANYDYRVIYKHTGQTNYKASAIVPKVNNGKDTVSFFIKPGSSPVMNIQRATVANDGTITWNNYYSVPTATLTALSGDKVYNVCLTMNASGAISIEKIEPYTGNYYIRTDCANSKWDNYRGDPDHLMTYSEYSIEHGGYSHYYCHWVKTDDRKNIKFTIANDYNPGLSDTLTRETASGTWEHISDFVESNGDIKCNTNVRFMWNQSTNAVSRAYVDGAQEDGSRFLVISSTDGKITKADGSSLSNNEVTFTDNENWIYEAYIQAKPNAAIKLLSNWGESNKITQYFKGSSSSTEKLIGGSGSDFNTIRVLYDFKTNRLIAALVPTSGNYESDNAIEADIMFIREHQGDVAQLTFGDAGKISKIETAYGVMRFNKWTMNNKSKEEGHSPLESPASVYERSLFWISFPFKVKLSEVFGFGTYGEHWAVQRYDGADRAARGHFQENGSFWKWMNRSTEYLEPNQGYLLAIDADLLTEDGGMWPNNIQNLELFFPSYGKMPDITSADVSQTILPHTCEIDWATTKGLPRTNDPRTSYDRTIFDSHWNVISVPTYVNTDDVTFANTTWTAAEKKGPKFLYTWNADDNTITATTASGYTYHAMHAYMTQYYGGITWSASSGSPASIVARRTYAEEPKEIEFNLELLQNEQMIDRAFVVLSADEEVSAGFKFGEDMTKEFNASRSAIYTFIPNEAAVAGNTLPMSDQTTVVPVGVDIIAEGEYIISLPEGTSGVGVTLIDNELQTRTNLALTDYAVTLPAGTYDERFVLEISPIEQTTTGVEAMNGANGDASLNGVCKKLIDGVLYIVKDGKVFDARGARIQ